MSTITTKDGTEIYYKDWGEGPVVTFSHGWPLNADAWDGQMLFLALHGYRVVAHDRRGHGRSSQASLKFEANPEGLPLEVFDGRRAGLVKDRSQFYKDLAIQFYGANRPGAEVSQGGSWISSGCGACSPA